MSGPHDVKENLWDNLTQDELWIVYEIDNMDRSVQSHEANFLSQTIAKLKEQGETNAVFSAKQRNWIHAMADKYLGG